jgi:3-(3-hydroxy-phenyl)propionate hydroxylase
MSVKAPIRRVQVIVAGAGPAGVVAAYRLAQRGIDVLLLEAQPFCPEDMRASTFHPPTLDMMEELGLLDALAAVGLRAPIYQYRNRSTGAVLQLDMGEVADVLKHPYRLQCEQFKLTRLVTGLLKDHPHAEVKFSRRVVHFEQDESGVTVQVEAPNELETYKADYVIAADGANSLIRKYLGTEFEGFTYAEKFLTLSTDTPLEQHFDNLADVNYVADAKEWCVLLKVPTLWRVLVPAREDESDAALLSDEKKTAVFNGLVPDGAAVKTYHRTLYRVHQRVAKKYRHGRVILVGDSAHLNNPLGGFGMNSGVHDVWNLTDRLTEIFKEGADADARLDLFERQRRTVMQEFVQAQTIRNKKMMEAVGDAPAMQTELEAVIADPARRRDHLLRQAMVFSREREAEIV